MWVPLFFYPSPYPLPKTTQMHEQQQMHWRGEWIHFLFCFLLCAVARIMSSVRDAQLALCLIQLMGKLTGQVTFARFQREVAGPGLRASLSHSKSHPGTIRCQTQGERAGLFKDGQQSKKMERTWVLDGRLNSEDLPTSMLLIRQGNQCLSLKPLLVGCSTICGWTHPWPIHHVCAGANGSHCSHCPAPHPFLNSSGKCLDNSTHP